MCIKWGNKKCWRAQFLAAPPACLDYSLYVSTVNYYVTRMALHIYDMWVELFKIIHTHWMKAKGCNEDYKSRGNDDIDDSTKGILIFLLLFFAMWMSTLYLRRKKIVKRVFSLFWTLCISSAESRWINKNVYSPVSYENLHCFHWTMHVSWCFVAAHKNWDLLFTTF